MLAVLNSNPDLPFVLSDTFPGNFQGVQLQGAVVTTADYPGTGTVVLQKIEGAQFAIVYRVFDLKQPCSLVLTLQESFLLSFIALKNVLRYSFKELGHSVLQQGQFILMHNKAPDVRMDFEVPGVYQALEISWPEKMVAEVLPSFTLLQPLQEIKNMLRSFFVTPYSKTGGFKILGMAHTLMRFPHRDANSQYLFEHKIKEYLLSLLVAAEKVPRSSPPVSATDFGKMQQLYKQLHDHPDQKFPISAMARQINMSEKKLKRLFVQVFGMPMFEFHLEMRMKEAHRLLEEADYNTKEIAAMVGYRLTTSFITKFREFFGYPPSGVKKNN